MADSIQDLGAVTDLLRMQPNWTSEPQLTMEFTRNILSYPGTVVNIISWFDDSPHMLDYEYFFETKQAEKELLDFFTARSGRVHPFWLLGFHQFFVLSQQITNNSPILYVKKNDFDRTYQGFERVYIRMSNGDILTKKVISVVPGPGSDELTLQVATNFDRDIPVGTEVFRLYFVRFNIDEIKIDYGTNAAGKISAKFYELIREYPA